MKTARHLLLTLSLAVLALPLACHNRSSSSGSLRVTLSVSPDHPRMTKRINLQVHVDNPQGEPVNDARVTGELTMKLMDMGTTKLTFAPKGNGDYEAQVKSVDMSGPWSLAVNAKRGGAEAKQTFDVNVFD